MSKQRNRLRMSVFTRKGEERTMLFLMHLQRKYYDMVEAGKKTVDIRLLDWKRSIMKTGDFILFADNNEEKCLLVRVKELSRTYGSFGSFFRDVSPDKCGFISPGEAVDVMNNIYTKDAVKKDGIIGIWFELEKDV